VCAVLSMVVFAATALAKRVAMVVGITDYTHSRKLPNARNDAASMTQALQASGFDVVQSLDQDQTEIYDTLDRFYAKASAAETAVFFFAGHGIQFDGVNYLVPKSAELRSISRLKQETVALQDIISEIEKRAGITLVFLDACRDNPLAEELQRSLKGTTRSAAVSRGLAPMEIRNPDTLLVFAAAPGKTASDGAGANSPFTAALVQNIAEPGVEIEQMMKRVARDVRSATGGTQAPERLSKLTTEFIFTPAQSTKALTVEPARPASDTPSCKGPNPPISCLWNR